MTTTNMQATTNPANTASDQEHADSSDDIRAAEAKVREDEKWSNRANKTSFWLAAVYALITAAIALAGLWTIRAGGRLRASENLLNSLRIAKVKADAETEAKRIETGAQKEINKARSDAEERLKIETKRVEGEAGAKIEDAKAEAGVKIENARAEAAREIGKVQVEVAAQQERAAKAERALLELQERLRPRTLTPEQRAQLVELLRRGPKGTISLSCPVNDIEAHGFATLLEGVLEDAGWNPGEVVFAALKNPPVGVRIIQRNGGAAIPSAQALADALIAVGVTIDLRFDPNLSEGDLRVIVGTKPLPH